MKLTAIMLLSACLTVGAKGISQTVTLDLKDVPIQKVFREMIRQTGISILYNEAVFKDATPVTIKVKDTPVGDVLNMVLKNQPFEFIIENNSIIVKQKQAAEANQQPAISLNAAFIDIGGHVSNMGKEPLSGASITIQRTKKGTLTDVKGNFVLKGVQQGDVIIISYIGYKPRIIKPGSDGYVNVVLETTDNELDKVVVQAYGTTSRRFATGNIATVTAAEIEKQPVMNPLLALQGRVAGLEVVQTSGYASAPLKVEIRGRGTVDYNRVTDPLYIVDGVPLSVLELSGSSSYSLGSTGFIQNPGLTGPANGQSPLFSINPADIESISVLKDADATSIYGSRGANGVIIITTKKGKSGKTKFDIHVDQGINKITRFWKMLNTPQYLEMRREAFRNDAIAPDHGNAPDLLSWDTTRYTNWQKALFGKAGLVTNVQVGVSGGDLHTTFRIGAGYNHFTDITTASGANKRASVNFNITHRSGNDRLSISLTGSYSYAQSNLIWLPQFITYAPDAPAIYDYTGQLNWKEWRPIEGGNPFGTLLYTYVSKTNFLNGNFGISYQLIRGLSLSINSGYSSAQANQFNAIPIASNDPVTLPQGSAMFGINNNKNWVIEPQITYDARLGKGKFNVLVGGSAQGTTSDGVYIEGNGYTNDNLLHNISNAPRQTTKNTYGEYRYASIFARIGYNWENKYIINLNARRDGSSNYGPGNQFGNFASVGGAWIFTEENWLKQHLPVLSFGKLRGSYGIAGSDGGKPYAYITRWSSNGLQTYTEVRPIAPIQHANPNYRWEQNRQLEGAIELGFFKDWITIGAAYYRRRTGNQLLSYPTALMTGFESVIANLQALVQNAGWEFNIGGRGVHVHTKYFNWDWSPRFNFSINQNKFLSFPGLGSSPFRNRGQIGQPLNSVYVLHYTGVDPQTGIYTFEDKNHDGVINNQPGPKGDGYYKKTTPSFSTGFGFDFETKGVHLSLFFIVKKQTGINAIAQGNYPGRFNFNQPVEVLARWQKPGDITNVGKFSTMYAQDPNTFLGVSDIGYTDASYIRLQNLSLSYSLPESFTKRSGLKCNLYVHANNLFTITKYKGIDPETQNFGGMPPAKTIVGGISLNF